MELRDVIITEASAFAERLTAAADAAVQQVKTDADAAIAKLHTQIEAVRAELKAQSDRADATAADLDGAKAEIEKLAGELDAQTKTTANLTSTLEAERQHLAQVHAQLEAASNRAADLAARLENETSGRSAVAAQLEKAQSAIEDLTGRLQEESSRASALAEKLEAETSRTATISAQLESETSRAAALTSQLEAESARVDTLTSELEAAQGARATAEAEWQKAQSALEQASAHADTLRGQLEAAQAEAARAAEALDAEAKQRTIEQQTHEAVVRDLQTQLGTVAADAAKARASFAEAESRARQGATSSDTQLRELQVLIEQQAEMLRTAEARIAAAEETAATLREEVDEANALTDATSTALSGIKDHARRVAGLLNGAAGALVELDKATTTAEVYRTLVRQLSGEFERVGIFRVKEKHLIGDIAEGLDSSLDIKKIVIPTGMNGLIAKATSAGVVEEAGKEQMADAGSPFGGSPTSAIAGALVFEGEVLAVLYAESDTLFTDAHGPFAGVLIRHANAIVGSLGQEVRAAKHLREYAHTLIHEAEVMFKADYDTGVPEKERIERLNASIGFARDLYSQRAALEAPLSSDLLEEEMAEIARDEQPTAFTTALGAVLKKTAKTRRTAAS